MQEQTYIIRKVLINSIKSIDEDTSIPLNVAIDTLQQKFNISKQAINKHLLNLEQEKYLIAQGKTKNKIYELGNNRNFSKTIKVNKNLDEFEVYNNDFYWVVEHLPKNIEEIIEWGFTEILNNVKDHSQAKEVFILLKAIDDKVDLIISDNGIGIF
jgi:signal transduction histidine kinase